jgi:predicted DNA binding CopG/RHH family protein
LDIIEHPNNVRTDMKLDKYEKELEDSFERGAWISVKNLSAEKKKLVKIAQATIRKNKTMNIRINEMDMNSLKARALEEGIPYQTLVTSILHKYVSGKLVEKHM